ncbi:MAG: isochorismatase family protein [Hyphomonas sp.]|nr:isochorismatase family protein [Hyphomonas sp.]
MSALEQDYSKAGFGGTLQFGEHPALLIVDVVRAYVDKDSPLYAGKSAEDALKANVRLRDAADKAGIPVIMTGVQYHPGGKDGGVFFRKVPALKAFERGNPMADFLPELSPREQDVVITKQYPSAFFGTALASMLTALGIDTVMITGYSTSGCVRASALDAMQYGFIPYVISDACADRDPAPHDANLFDLRAKYAEVLTTSEVINLLP